MSADSDSAGCRNRLTKPSRLWGTSSEFVEVVAVACIRTHVCLLHAVQISAESFGNADVAHQSSRLLV